MPLLQWEMGISEWFCRGVYRASFGCIHTEIGWSHDRPHQVMSHDLVVRRWRSLVGQDGWFSLALCSLGPTKENHNNLNFHLRVVMV